MQTSEAVKVEKSVRMRPVEVKPKNHKRKILAPRQLLGGLMPRPMVMA